MRMVCINLDRRTDRWEHASAQFARRGLTVERFSAIDGSQMDPRTIPVPIGPKVIEVKPPRPGPASFWAGTWASLLSHLTVWKEHLNQPVGDLLVFEDDVDLKHWDQRRISSFFMRVPRDWDAVYLWGKTKPWVPDLHIAHDIMQPGRMVDLTAYVLRHRFIPRLIHRVEAMIAEGRADWLDQVLADYMEEGWMRTYTFHPPYPCRQVMIGGSDNKHKGAI